jgi:hypothetical protein
MEKNLKSSFKPNWHTRANSKQLLNEWEKLETKKNPNWSSNPTTSPESLKLQMHPKKKPPWTPAPISQPQIKLQATQVTWETRNPLREIPSWAPSLKTSYKRARKEIQAYQKESL